MSSNMSTRACVPDVWAHKNLVHGKGLYRSPSHRPCQLQGLSNTSLSVIKFFDWVQILLPGRHMKQVLSSSGVRKWSLRETTQLLNYQLDPTPRAERSLMPSHCHRLYTPGTNQKPTISVNLPYYVPNLKGSLFSLFESASSLKSLL